MARSKLFHFALIAGAVMAATPALAQFGSIFRDDGPPRPPADVPSAPPGNNAPPYYAPSQPPPPPYYPSQDDRRYYPSRPQYQQPVYQQRQSDPDALRPPADVRTGADDVPPSEPQPPPMSLPPSSRPGGGGIQSQDLAPLPGTTQTPTEQQAPAQPHQANTNPAQPAPTPAPGAPNAQPQQPAQADQPQQPGQPQQPAAATPGAPPTEEVVVAPPPERIANPAAVFAGLDKITGRIISFDVAINETVQFGALQVTPRVCYTRPPTETPNTDSFVEVDEVTLQGQIRRIFTGWMFAASPGLHAVEHPIYDVWLTDCKGGKNPAVADASPQDASPQDPAPKPAAKPARPAPPLRRRVRPQAQQPAATLPPLR
ncbi:MAG TPA: DUF2155 domain-containing protein [Pseudolabrys sp.]|nr:DUF2155 domain-containing protein [Pseudolabrys sp.]